MKFLRPSAAIAVMTVGIAVSAFLGAAVASAHVTVAAPGVFAGASDAAITFRVPDESDSASTVGLKVRLPTDPPIAGVLVAPQTGWTATITNTKLATPIKTDDGNITEVVSEIDWTADPNSGIKPGFFGEFTVIAGKLPDDATSLTFKAIQTYSDKSVVSWIEEAAPGSTSEPEHPAPTLELAAAAGPGSAAPGTPTASAAPTVTAAAADTSNDSSGTATVGVVLSVIGILLGAAALALVLLRRRLNPTPPG